MNFGLCCKFVEAPIKYKTTTVKACKSLSKRDYINKISQIIDNNLDSLYKSLLFCFNNNIQSYRVGSDLFPLFDHDELNYKLEDLTIDCFQKIDKINQFINKTNIRLTIHPSQYTVLNSFDQSVVNNSIKILEYHNYLCELFQIDSIILHIGGIYNDKSKAIENFITNYNLLSDSIKSKLVIENDDKSFSFSDVNYISNCCKIPIVYDLHHDRCFDRNCDSLLNSLLAVESWNKFRSNLKPIFHISSAFDNIDNKSYRKHADYIDVNDFPDFWNELSVTIEVEAKHKELAIKKLQQDLNL